MTSDAQVSIDTVPSPSYSFEPEFTGQAPRPVPDRLSERPYARSRRTVSLALVAVAAACLLLSRAPGIDVLARYVLPLAYLTWISGGTLALAAASYLPLALRRGPFRYVIEGVPLAVRILDVVKTPTAGTAGVYRLGPTAHHVVPMFDERPRTGAAPRARRSARVAEVEGTEPLPNA